MMNNTTLLLSSMMNESSSSNYSSSSSSSSIGTDTMTTIPPIPIPTSHHKKRGTNIIIINIIFDVLKSSELMALQKLIQLPSSTTDIYDYHVHSEIPMDNIQNIIFVTHHRYQNNNDHDHLTTNNTNNAKVSFVLQNIIIVVMKISIYINNTLMFQPFGILLSTILK